MGDVISISINPALFIGQFFLEWVYKHQSVKFHPFTSYLYYLDTNRLTQEISSKQGYTSIS